METEEHLYFVFDHKRDAEFNRLLFPQYAHTLNFFYLKI